jgi:pyruvate dehydrogenase E1 component alpha subunit
MNVFSVREIFKFVKNYCITTGPCFLELDTYRYQGHSMSDPGISYRTRDEVMKVREQRDCITSIKKIIINAGFADEKDLKVTNFV